MRRPTVHDLLVTRCALRLQAGSTAVSSLGFVDCWFDVGSRTRTHRNGTRPRSSLGPTGTGLDRGPASSAPPKGPEICLHQF
ncbi:hypothetical protein D8S78_15290 [Natrialba swarupiae]|nr:hypothetical protein [Natrialba swarupiae]